MVDACLSPQEMERLARGELRGGARARAESHVQRCASCRARVEAHRPATTRASLRPAQDTSSAAGRARAAAAADSHDEIEGFRLLEEIHRGGQGVVYRAFDERRGEVVALKVLREGPFASPDQRMRFERESELARSLDHPLIVAPLVTGVSRGRPYHVMKYVEGLTLDAWARETQPSLRRVLEVFRDACDAVAHAHARGVVHRDLKPSNILVDARGKPHVVDFGVAKATDAGGGGMPLTVTGEFVGTLSHASPEQAQGDPRLVDERTDVYALGVIAYELLTGRMPYPVTGAPADVLRNVIETEPKHPASIRPEIDEALAAIVLKALEKSPARRYASVAALHDDVAAYLQGMPLQAQPQGAWDLLAKTARRNRRWFVVAAAFAALLAVVAVLAAAQARRFQTERDRAETAEAEARQRARDLEKATAVARREGYAANVSAGSLALRLGRLPEARRRLAACAEDLRGWEWGHLSRGADAAEATASAVGEPVVGLGTLPDGRAWRALPSGLDVLDPATLATLEHVAVPDVPRPDETARAEILAVNSDASLLALRWDDASWTRAGAAGRAVLVVDRGGRVQSMLSGGAWRASRATFSLDGRRLASTTTERYDAAPRAWSTLTGQGRRLGDGRSDGTAAPIAFSPGADFLVEGGDDGRVHCWVVDAGVRSWSSQPLGAPVHAVAWSRDGQRIAAATGGTTHVLARDGSLGIEVGGGAVRASCVALSSDATRVAAGFEDGTVRAWDAATGRALLEARGHEAAVTALAFIGEDGALLSGAGDGSVQRWTARAGAGPAPLLALARATCLTFAEDGAVVAAGALDGTVRSWRVETGDVLWEGRDLEGGISAIAAVPGRRELVTAGAAADGGSLGRSVAAWMGSAGGLAGVVATGEPLRLDSVPAARALAFSADGTRLAVASGAGLIRAWAWPARTPLASIDCPPEPRWIGFDEPGLVVAGWPDGTTRSWQLADGAFVQAWGCGETIGDAAPPERGAYARGRGRWVAAGVDDLRTCDADAATGTYPLAPAALAASPDGARLFAGDSRGTLTIFTTETLEPLLTLEAHAGAITAVGVSPDGKTVATAGPDGVRLFRTR